MVEVPSPSSYGASPSTSQALDDWTETGQPRLDALLTSLHRDNVILDPTLQILVFSIVGAYTHNFTKSWSELRDFHFAHASALSKVMSHPAVAGLATQFMSDMVAGKVGGMI